PVFTSENIGLTLPFGISNLNPGVSEVVTLTAPAGYTFDDTTNIALGGNATVVTSRAADGSTVSFVPLPGSTGIPQVDGVTPTASPLNRLTLPAEGTVTVPADVPVLPGTDNPATAPNLPVPGVGEASVQFDKPDFLATIDHFYALTVPAGTFDITVDWTVGSDVDFVLCNADCSAFVADTLANQFPGATAAHPEIGTYELAAGTYVLLVEDFGGDANEATVTISLNRTE
ncbi:MAG TPA: hypothetical protein VJ794_11980, partial [Gemmatimonadales bacterium]|nr:hypothetical protein [Gemmatimonadales bacterium]